MRQQRASKSAAAVPRPHKYSFLIANRIRGKQLVYTFGTYSARRRLFYNYAMPPVQAADLPLRLWVLCTGLAGLGAAIGAYTRPLSPHKTLYSGTTTTANAEFARMYATWLLLSTTIRVTYFLHPVLPPDPLFYLTAATYAVALVHFALEIFVHATAPLRPGGIAPLVVASVSLVWFGSFLL